MKKLFYSLVTILFIQVSFNIDICLSQWQADVRLTNNSASSLTSKNNAWCIASSGNTVHAVWYDQRNSFLNWEIYYKRSTDGGVTWGADTRLTYDSSDSRYPSIAVSGQDVHVVWYDNRNSMLDYEIYYKHSTDGGTTWGAETRLTNDPNDSRNPSVAVSGSNVSVVWYDNRDGNNEIYYKRSTNNGVSWGADTRLTNDVSDSQLPSIAVSGLFVHVVWQDNNSSYGLEIYYKNSTNGGATWGTNTRLTNNLAISQSPSISVSGSTVSVVWEDNRDGNYEIYYKRSTNGGTNWGADTRLTNQSANSLQSSVTASGSAVHVVWEDDRAGFNNWEIYYIRSTNAGLSWETETRLTNDPSYSRSSSVSASGTVVHVVWYDIRDMNQEIYYKRNPTGNPIGIINISSEIPSSFSLCQNYPNPFNPTTVIRFSLPATSGLRSRNVSLKVFDISGKEVETLVNEKLQPGTYESSFDGSRHGRSSTLTSGVYFYKLITEGFSETKKMLLLK